MIVKLLNEHHLEFLSSKGGCRGSPESTFFKMSNCWKSNAPTQIVCLNYPDEGTLHRVHVLIPAKHSNQGLSIQRDRKHCINFADNKNDLEGTVPLYYHTCRHCMKKIMNLIFKSDFL